jgi:hypothetical protein
MHVDALAELVAIALARWRRWSPVGQPLCIAVDDSGDARLAGRTLSGVVRGYDQRENGALTRLLIELDQPLDYTGHYIRTGLRWLVAEPCLQWRRTSRLWWSWSVARIVDAPSFVDSTYDRTIGIARLSRCPRVTFLWR